MRQSGTKTLVTEEPYAFIAHVRVCGGAGWVTTGSTRKPTPPAFARASLRLLARLTAGVRLLTVGSNRENTTMSAQRIDTVVIGGGQAGLAMSYYLTQQGRA